MATYILLSTLSTKGVQTLKANPARLREVNRDVEELGAKVLHQWATLGPFDFVNIVEAPDAQTISRVSIALAARGSAKLQTLQAFSIDDSNCSFNVVRRLVSPRNLSSSRWRTGLWDADRTERSDRLLRRKPCRRSSLALRRPSTSASKTTSATMSAKAAPSSKPKVSPRQGDSSGPNPTRPAARQPARCPLTTCLIAGWRKGS